MKRDLLRLLTVFTMVASLSFAFIGCGQKTVKVDEAEDTATVAETADSSGQDAEASAVESAEINEGMGPAESLDSQAAGFGSAAESMEGRTSNGMYPVYFDFDQSLVREDQVERIEKNAMFMKENPQITVQIEGNCDERGTNEYNMALGERRAMSSKKYMVNLGVAENRLSTISYGEERPINFGHDELSWSQNRRDDFVANN